MRYSVRRPLLNRWSTARANVLAAPLEMACPRSIWRATLWIRCWPDEWSQHELQLTIPHHRAYGGFGMRVMVVR
jgi:hypothetical protein